MGFEERDSTQILMSLCIPVYNREALVSEAIRSALRQDIPNMEVVIVDNCSTDRTWDVIQEFTSDSRVRVIRNPTNLGLFGNFNRCLELARGEFIRFLCSDDRLKNGRLIEEMKCLQKHPQATLLNTPCLMVDSAWRPLGSSARYLPSGIYKGSDVNRYAMALLAHYGKNLFNFPSGILVRRRAAQSVGLFDENLHGLADFDYWLRLLDVGDLVLLEEPGCEIMEHPQRESYPLFFSGLFMKGVFKVVLKRKALQKDERDPFQRHMYSLAGRCFWYVFKCLKRRRLDAALVHWKMISDFKISYSSAFFSFFKIMISMIRMRFQPEASRSIALPIPKPLIESVRL